MSEDLKISPNCVDVYIPVELVNYVLTETKVCGRYLTKRKEGNKTHPMMKIMGLFLLLKAESPGSSLIQNYTKQIPTLCASFSLSRRTFYYHIGELERLKLITKDSEGNLRIASWQQLGKQLDINTNRKTKIKFNYGSKQQIHWWFAALDIKSNQELQADTVWKKAHKNSNVESILREALLKRGFDLKQENNPVYYCKQLLTLMIEDFRFGTEVHDILISIRSDVNRTCKLIAKSWSMSLPLLCYWRKKMTHQQITCEATIEIMSEWERDRQDCGKNKFCRVVWDDKEKQRVWRLCKQISVIMPGESWEKWKEKNEKNLAA